MGHEVAADDDGFFADDLHQFFVVVVPPAAGDGDEGFLLFHGCFCFFCGGGRW